VVNKLKKDLMLKVSLDCCAQGKGIRFGGSIREAIYYKPQMLIFILGREIGKRALQYKCYQSAENNRDNKDCIHKYAS